jgi:hypothetical protein
MAWLRAFTFNSFIPPSFMGKYSELRFTGAFLFS